MSCYILVTNAQAHWKNVTEADIKGELQCIRIPDKLTFQLYAINHVIGDYLFHLIN